MKFGKRLLSEANCAIGVGSYVNYKQLKGMIKRAVKARQGSPTNGQDEDVAEGEEFLNFVSSEAERTAALFVKMIAENAPRVEKMKEGKEVEVVREAYIELQLLLAYAQLNIEAVETIAKKFRKNSKDQPSSLKRMAEILVAVHVSDLAKAQEGVQASIKEGVEIYARITGAPQEQATQELQQFVDNDRRSVKRVVAIEKSAFYDRAMEQAPERTYRCKILCGRAHEQLGQDVAECTTLNLEDSRIGTFANGEIDIKILNNMRGDDVFILQSTVGTPQNPADINTALMELLLLVNTCRLASAKRITAIVPYLAYSRQDRKTQPRVPISASAVATLLKSMSIDRLMTVDLHCAQIQGFYGNTPVDNLFAMKEFVKFLREKKLPSNLAVVSPDAGGVERARGLADDLGAEQVVTILKRRTEKNKVDSMQIVGDVKGKPCVIIDDMIDTAGTLVKAANLLQEHGATSVIACATHGLLTAPATERIMNCSALSEVVVTDSVPQAHNLESCEKLRVLTIAPLLAQAIHCIHHEESLSELFNPRKK